MEAKYAASYSASVDPFAAWRAKAADERRAAMGIHDRFALSHRCACALPLRAAQPGVVAATGARHGRVGSGPLFSVS